jgi:hypothetical protein
VGTIALLNGTDAPPLAPRVDWPKVGLTTWQVLRLRMSPAGPRGLDAHGLRVSSPFGGIR